MRRVPVQERLAHDAQRTEKAQCAGAAELLRLGAYGLVDRVPLVVGNLDAEQVGALRVSLHGGTALDHASTLMKSGGTLVMALRNGPAADGMTMHRTYASEVEGRARTYGLEVLRVASSPDQEGGDGVNW
jgi:hypothetical protein